MSRPQVIRARSRWIYGGLALGALALIARLSYLQVVKAPQLTALAQQQRTREIDLAATRGEIADRKGHELAVSVEAFSVYAQPAEFEDPIPTIAARLAPVLGAPPPELEKNLAGKHWRWLSRQREGDVAKAVKALRIPGIGVVKESKRLYPKGTLAANILGFVGVDNQGLAGLEHDFNDVLLGGHEKLLVQVDARGREILRENSGSPLRSIDPERGQVVLTLDETIQHIAQRELGLAIAKLNAKRGAVLVMDPKNGNLLAYALWPTYDPNHYREVDWSVIKNWVANDIYEPGSTMKIFTVAAALEAGTIRPDSVFNCGPTITIGKHTISDHDAPAGLRKLTPEDILEVSSNVGALQVGLTMASSYHRKTLQAFGFGLSTGSGIKGESRGLLPTLPWPTMRQGSISFGYGLSTTPLQILSAASAIADDGLRHPPRLIDRVEDGAGHVLKTFPVATASPAISPATARTVRAMLATVVRSGTGTAARIPGYNVAGKTGTANKSRAGGLGYTSDVIASFLGFVPAEKPQLVVLALLDSPQNAHFASMTAAPLFRSVAAETLRYLGVRPASDSIVTETSSHAAH